MDEVSKFAKHLRFFSDVYSNAETELSKIYAVLMGKLVTFPYRTKIRVPRCIIEETRK